MDKWVIYMGRNAGDQSPQEKIPRRGTRDGLNTIVYANLCLRKHLALIPDGSAKINQDGEKCK
jgi:hypothetical protein